MRRLNMTHGSSSYELWVPKDTEMAESGSDDDNKSSDLAPKPTSGKPKGKWRIAKKWWLDAWHAWQTPGALHVT